MSDQCPNCAHFEMQYEVEKKCADNWAKKAAQEAKRADALDDLVRKSVEVTKFYDADRLKLQQQIEKLKTDLSHSDAAWGLEIESRDRMIAELRKVAKDG